MSSHQAAKPWRSHGHLAIMPFSQEEASGMLPTVASHLQPISTNFLVIWFINRFTGSRPGHGRTISRKPDGVIKQISNWGEHIPVFQCISLHIPI
jgi:hypothetical protein